MIDIDHIAYDLIMEEVEPGSKVLDLGCGDGTLLQKLQKHLTLPHLYALCTNQTFALEQEHPTICFFHRLLVPLDLTPADFLQVIH